MELLPVKVTRKEGFLPFPSDMTVTGEQEEQSAELTAVRAAEVGLHEH